MPKNQAYRLHGYGGPDVLQFDEVPVPAVGAGQVLVAVKAAGVNQLDWKVREGYLREAFPLTLPATLGVEFAGMVTQTGEGTSRFAAGDRVMGLLHGLGTYAEHIAVAEATLARIPDVLNDVAAAALPIPVLTAWQSFHAAGEPHPGLTVLIHGAAGAVGGFAVQFAKAAGAKVLATASATSRDYVIGLGADLVFDYRTERFEDQAEGVDLVLDFVGGDTLDRSWGVLAPGGSIATIVATDIVARTPPGARGFWVITHTDPTRLDSIAQDVAEGRVRSTIAEVFGLKDLGVAIESNRVGHGPGKIVVDFTL